MGRPGRTPSCDLARTAGARESASSASCVRWASRGSIDERAEAAPDGAPPDHGYQADQQRAPDGHEGSGNVGEWVSLSHNSRPRLDVLSDSLVLSAVAALLARDTERGGISIALDAAGEARTCLWGAPRSEAVRTSGESRTM